MANDPNDEVLQRVIASDWTTAIPHALSDAVVSAVAAALERDWVFGLHMYFAGGRSADEIAIRAVDQYLDRVQQSRSGDLFILWSIDTLRKHGKIIAEKAAGEEPDDGNVKSAIELLSSYIKRGLSRGQAYEFTVLSRRDVAPNVQIRWGDFDYLAEAEEFLTSNNSRDDRWCIVPFTEVDRPQDVEPGAYILVKAKRPNDSGEVPVKGPY